MNQIILAVMLCATIVGIIYYAIDIDNLTFICDNYIISIYLYLILSWCILLTFIKVIDVKQINTLTIFLNSLYFFVYVIGLFAIMTLLRKISSNNLIGKHIIYTLYLFLLSILLHQLYVYDKSLFSHVGFTTIAIIAGLSVVTHLYPDIVSDSWGPYLFIGLCALIIARIIDYFFIKSANNYISYIAIVLFSVYLMYDTKQIIKQSKQCNNPDYINDSMKIFLDTLNLFSNIFSVKSNRRTIR